MISSNFAALQIVVPLMAALATVFWRRPRRAWLWATLVSWAAFVFAILIAHRVLTHGAFSYFQGNWQPPWGIEYHIDPLNALMLLIVSGIAAVVMPFSLKSVEREVDADRIPFFYSAFLLSLTGLLGISITGDVFNLFVFLEIASISTYALVAMGKDRRALTAAYRYLIMGATGATFIVIGIGLMYSVTGSLNMADLARLLPHVRSHRILAAAFAFLTVGISLKLALFPLHLWLPNAYAYAPSSVTAFVASTSTKVAVYMLLRFFFTIFGFEFSFHVMELDHVLLPLALVAILTASIVAIYQEDAKRMLAYSSLAQIGYIILGISMGTVTGLTAGILHVFNHALMKGALFMALGCVMYRVGSVRLDRMEGIGKTMPWTMAAFVIGGFSLIGVPLTVGFISKWYLVLGAIQRGWWPVAVIIVVGSLLAVVYVWKVVEVAYFRPAPESHRDIREAPLLMLVPTWVLIVANLYFGIDAHLTTGVAGKAAALLLGVGR